MSAWSPNNKPEFTAKQLEQIRIAGMPDNRPNLGGEYPKMVYKAGDNAAHQHLSAPLKVQGRYDLDMATVDNAEEEAEAIAQGWSTSPDLETVAKKRDELAERDAEIARLQQELAARPTTAPAEKPRETLKAPAKDTAPAN